MGAVRLSSHVDRPLERVAVLCLQLERVPEWQHDILGVKGIAGPPDHTGATYTLVYWRLGRRLKQRMVVTQYDPPRLIQQTANTPLGGRMTSSTRLEPAAGGTDVHWQMDYRLPGGPIGALLDRLLFRAAFARAVNEYNENLRALAEGRRPPHQPVAG